MTKIKIFVSLFTVGALVSACTQNKKEVMGDDVLSMIVGTYTGTGSHGIYSFHFNQATSDYELLDSCSLVNPSYLTISADGKFIYAVNEIDDSIPSVTSLAFNGESGAFKVLNSQPTMGTSPCYIATNGTVVTTANYGGSMSVFPIEPDGTLGAMQYFYEGKLGGPDTTRQEVPHIHCTEFTPDNKLLLASDFSADKLKVFRVDDHGGIFPIITDDDDTMAIELDADSGPRHIVFSSDGKFAYVLGELSGVVTVLENDSDTYKPIQTIAADEWNGRGAGDIHISPDGKFLYASVRLINDGIAVFSIDHETGLLSKIDYTRTGAHPRNFNITPNGKYLLCACRDTNSIDIFEIDITTGKLTATDRSISLPKPVCIKFE